MDLAIIERQNELIDQGLPLEDLEAALEAALRIGWNTDLTMTLGDEILGVFDALGGIPVSPYVLQLIREGRVAITVPLTIWLEDGHVMGQIRDPGIKIIGNLV